MAGSLGGGGGGGGALLAALHLAVWQMLALMGTHREGASWTACPGFRGGVGVGNRERSRLQGRQWSFGLGD